MNLPLKNSRVENTPETFQARLEKAARIVSRDAAELTGGFLIPPEHMAMLRAVLDSKPKAGR